MDASAYTTWAAFRKAEDLAERIFLTSIQFPPEERYSLTDQIRRSSRSVCANLAESYAKRRYPKHFISKLSDSAAENYETQTWLRFALRCSYIDQNTFNHLTDASQQIGKLLSYMIKNHTKFT